MLRCTTLRGFIVLLAAIGILSGCGGGGETPQTQAPPPSGPVSVFAWAAPATFNDNTPLNPSMDIDYYELYLGTDPNFTDGDQPAVEIAAVADNLSPDGTTVVRSPVTQFTLEFIPSIPSGNLLYVSMRAVGIDRQKSAFMAPVAWDRS
jgi:hypothetical protein